MCYVLGFSISLDFAMSLLLFDTENTIILYKCNTSTFNTSATCLGDEFRFRGYIVRVLLILDSKWQKTLHDSLGLFQFTQPQYLWVSKWR